MDTPTILIVEDSKFFASMLRQRIENDLGFEVEWKATYGEAVAALDCCRDSYLAALLDLTLPDAPNGEIVDYALKKGIPSLVFSGGLTSQNRERFLSWNLVDYILKDSPGSVETLLHALDRLAKNRSVKALVADDSKTMRDTVAGLLRTHLYQVFEAENGVEALRVMGEHPDIKLVITDYEMPEMDGFELIRSLRENHTRNELAVIGMSASGEPLLSARLIKSGADDFVPKPFQVEEFNCRVGRAMEMLDNIGLIQRLSHTDPLTGLANRRFFFDKASGFIDAAKAEGRTCSVAMVDIDHFKSVNDKHGHDGGDEVLKTAASLLAKGFAKNALAARFGGEEFCLLLAHAPDADPAAMLDGFRRTVADTETLVGGASVSVTVSVGAAPIGDDLDATISKADERLYEAKNSGRNKVVAG